MTADFDRARAHFVAGNEAFEASRFEDAEREFHASLALLPGRPSTLANLAATQIRLDRPAEALKTLDGIPGEDAAASARVRGLKPAGRRTRLNRGVTPSIGHTTSCCCSFSS